MRLYVGLALAVALIAPAVAQTTAAALERARYMSCLDLAAEDADTAFEEALSWRIEGGGWLAGHCEARARIGLGDVSGGAGLLDELAGELRGPDADFAPQLHEEAAQAWLDSGDYVRALAAAQSGADLDDLRPGLWRLLAEAAREGADWALMENAAGRLIRLDEESATGWRLRAEARLENDDVEGAHSDMETALVLEPENIDTLVLRGRILEARRLRG